MTESEKTLRECLMRGIEKAKYKDRLWNGDFAHLVEVLEAMLPPEPPHVTEIYPKSKTVFREPPQPSVPICNNCEIRNSVIGDMAEYESNIRTIAQEYIGEYEAQGDSYGVPTVDDVVKKLVAHFKKRSLPSVPEDTIRISRKVAMSAAKDSSYMNLVALLDEIRKAL